METRYNKVNFKVQVDSLYVRLSFFCVEFDFGSKKDRNLFGSDWKLGKTRYTENESLIHFVFGFFFLCRQVMVDKMR